MDACAAPGVSASRIITPALVHELTFWTDATRATISPSPVNDCDANWNASALPQMSAPDPLTVKVCEAESKAVLPAGVTDPISPDVQGLGSAGAGGVAPLVTLTLSNVAVASVPFTWLL